MLLTTSSPRLRPMSSKLVLMLPRTAASESYVAMSAITISVERD